LKEITVGECTEQDGQVGYRETQYVPEGDQSWLRLILEHHDTALSRNVGQGKTFDYLDRQYYWKEMRRQVDQYVRNWHSGQQSTTSRHAMFGVLRPVSLPEKPLEDISMDFMVGLPECKGFDAVWVVVNSLPNCDIISHATQRSMQ
jgi:hypothetical protein